jgi:alcohol dehydrogenase (NADP+)
VISQFKLNTGAQIPAVGFGTWQDKDAQENAVEIAIKAGYRHIDTARVYGTEAAVAKGMEKAGVPRSELFLTTKLWNNSHHPDDVERALDASLKDLKTDYVDLYLMVRISHCIIPQRTNDRQHWPVAFARSDSLFPKDKDDKIRVGNMNYVDTYRSMEACYKKGKAKAIGISNFSKGELENLLENTEVVSSPVIPTAVQYSDNEIQIPAAHQLELHPWLQQKSFCEFNKIKGIHITQYSPFGNQNEIYDSGKNMGKLMDESVLVEIGKKHNKSGAQVALAWGIASGHSVIPKSKTESRIKQNLEGDFQLSSEEIERIGGLDKKLRFNDPSSSFGWNFYNDLDGKI